MSDDLYFAVSITAPIFCIIGSGLLFRKIGWLDEAFARMGSKLVFNVSLPCLLFVKLVETDFRHELPFVLIGYAAVMTVGAFWLLERFAGQWLENPFDRGAFVQGAFRGNMGIVGLAFCIGAFGDSVIAVASIYLAVLTPLYNVLAVITLSRHQPAALEGGVGRGILLAIVKNPLILSILAGVLVSVSAIRVPGILLESGGYLARMALPLALICAGASIRPQEFGASRALYLATVNKLLVIPLVLTLGGLVIGLRGEALGVLYLMSSAPTAAASFPMTQAMGGNYHLAAAIIAATSLGAILSTTCGLFMLRVLGLV
ncbi:MAG: AEC family transporter [Desulfuromonadaceae bacterium]|nr:AEC family transporter [Desulfuromonadaceae bacterium]